jgi:adenylosuccinate synthase
VNGEEVVLRQLPAAAGHPNALLLLSAGCAVSEDVLLEELDRCRVPPERVVVDPRAVLVTAEDIKAEQDLAESIGSTASGTGSALARRLLRGRDVQLVKDSRRLRGRARIESVASLLHGHLDVGGHVIVEGTQGFGLSLLHGPDYPHVTARDTTAAGFAAEVGLSPRQIDGITMVVRTFPIRVGGNSGELANEIEWMEVQKLSGAPQLWAEYTSVTKRLRRVGTFDLELVKLACRYNRPTQLAVMGADRLNHANYRLEEPAELTPDVHKFLEQLHDELDVPIRWVGTGFGTFEAIRLDAHSLLS